MFFVNLGQNLNSLPVIPLAVKRSVESMAAAGNFSSFRPSIADCCVIPKSPAPQMLTHYHTNSATSLFSGLSATSQPQQTSALSSLYAAAAQSTIASSQIYNHTAAKQNLEAIVEAIRHLEGDQLFVDTGHFTNSSRLVQSLIACEQNDSGISSPVAERIQTVFGQHDPVVQMMAAAAAAASANIRPQIIMTSASS